MIRIKNFFQGMFIAERETGFKFNFKVTRGLVGVLMFGQETSRYDVGKRLIAVAVGETQIPWVQVSIILHRPI